MSNVMDPIKRKFKEDFCPICMESNENVTALNPCLHEFCLCCIGSWLVNNFSCPKCKQIPHLLIYKIKNDFFHSSFLLNSQFIRAWTQRVLIILFFKSQSQRKQLLRKRLQLLLKNFSYPVDFQRKMIYFCRMKTTLFKNYKTIRNLNQLCFDSCHQIWKWLKIELSIFYPNNKVDKILDLYKRTISTYSELTDALSSFIPPHIFNRFSDEMNAFLSFSESCESYYSSNKIKMVSGNLPEYQCDSVIIDRGSINLRLFCQLVVSKIFDLEFRTVDLDSDDLSPIYEISHLNHLVDTFNLFNNDCISLLTKFVNIRLRRSVRSVRHEQLNYVDYFNLIPEYAQVYLNCYKDHMEISNRSPRDPANEITASHPPVVVEVIDLTRNATLPQEIIDLTDDNNF